MKAGQNKKYDIPKTSNLTHILDWLFRQQSELKNLNSNQKNQKNRGTASKSCSSDGMETFRGQ